MKLREKIQLIRQSIINTAFIDRFRDSLRKDLLADIEALLVKKKFEDLAYSCERSGVSQVDSNGENIIVSLTTHGKRITIVHRTIESIFQQSLQANKVVLYVGDKEYQSIDQLPIVLRRQIDRGLEVRFVPDQGPYTKILPALRDFPENPIITIDDDILYPINAIERLVVAHQSKPNAICALETRMIVKKGDRKFAPYNDFPFPHDSVDLISNMYIAEGFGGVLYPPHCFSERVHDYELILKLAPKADDLWLKAMSLLDGCPLLKVHDFYKFNKDRYIDPDVQDTGLFVSNLFNGGNDKQLTALFDHFQLYDYLNECIMPLKNAKPTGKTDKNDE